MRAPAGIRVREVNDDARHDSAELDIALHDGEFNVLQLDFTTRQEAETQNSQLQRPVAEFPALGGGNL
jgi:hypothetical protein